MSLSVTILGVNSAMPVYGRHPSAQVLTMQNKSYLLDCGEGTQMRLAAYRIRPSKISHIFITHLHGDHYLGLLPLLDSFHLSGRKKPVYLFAPPALAKVIAVHKELSGGIPWNFPLHFHATDATKSEVIWETRELTVETVPLIHGIPCTGFVFREKPKKRKMIGTQIERYSIPYEQIGSIKSGADFTTPNGQVIPNAELTLLPAPAQSYAYCADTAYCEAIIPHIRGVDMLYHEATYLEELAEQAKARHHATAKQAATIARKAGVGKLILGHYSSRYRKLSPFLEEARPVFPNTHLGIEGRVYRSFELS